MESDRLVLKFKWENKTRIDKKKILESSSDDVRRDRRAELGVHPTHGNSGYGCCQPPLDIMTVCPQNGQGGAA